MRYITIILLSLITVGCAGLNKGCAQLTAGSFGSSWIIVQYDMTGRPFHCWKLSNAAVESEGGGNVDWQDYNGHLVHVTGWENRVQVRGGNFAEAGLMLGVDANVCGSGVYPTR